MSPSGSTSSCGGAVILEEFTRIEILSIEVEQYWGNILN